MFMYDLNEEACKWPDNEITSPHLCTVTVLVALAVFKYNYYCVDCV